MLRCERFGMSVSLPCPCPYLPLPTLVRDKVRQIFQMFAASTFLPEIHFNKESKVN